MEGIAVPQCRQFQKERLATFVQLEACCNLLLPPPCFRSVLAVARFRRPHTIKGQHGPPLSDFKSIAGLGDWTAVSGRPSSIDYYSPAVWASGWGWGAQRQGKASV